MLVADPLNSYKLFFALHMNVVHKLSTFIKLTDVCFNCLNKSDFNQSHPLWLAWSMLNSLLHWPRYRHAGSVSWNQTTKGGYGIRQMPYVEQETKPPTPESPTIIFTWHESKLIRHRSNTIRSHPTRSHRASPTTITILTPSMPQSVKFPGLKMHGRACKQYIFWSYNTSTFNVYV